MSTNLYSWAADSIRRGLSANEGLRQLRAGGERSARQTWLRLYSSVKADFERRDTVASADLSRKPRGAEIHPMTVERGSGFMQHLDIWVKDKVTGEVYARPFTIQTDTLMSHADAIETGLDVFGVHADGYGETILGAAYVSTYQLGQWE